MFLCKTKVTDVNGLIFAVNYPTGKHYISYMPN